jgi:protein TonB
MASACKPLFASLFVHGAVVLMAATLGVPQPGVPAMADGTDAPWGLCLVADTPSEFPESASRDDLAVALPPEPATESQPAILPSPSLPPVEISPAALDRIAVTGPSSLPAIDPPPTIAKQAPRKDSRVSAASRGGATRSAGAAGNGARNGAAAYIPARYAICPAPPFPDEARKAKIFGTVLLLVAVDENGRPVEVEVRHSSGHDVLDSAALRAVRKWRFEPARLGGRQVNARVEIPVRFAAS